MHVPLPCNRFPGLVVTGLLIILFPAISSNARQTHAAQTIACRVMEADRDARLGVAIAIVHQKNTQERESFANFLRIHDGGTVTAQLAAGMKFSAHIHRLKSCFGRGLLLFALPGARLAEGDTVFLSQ